MPARAAHAATAGSLTVVGARENNLKDVTRRLPARALRVRDRGVAARARARSSTRSSTPRWRARCTAATGAVGRARRRSTGLAEIDKVIDIDQSPIGRTPRSNPATYTKLFDLIRDFFALLPEARMHGYTPGRFSFNVKGGRCEACEGDGVKRVEMHFLPDVYVPCEVCHGKRFNEATLQVKYNGLSIADVLDLTVDEALRPLQEPPADPPRARDAGRRRPRLHRARPALAHALRRRGPARQALARAVASAPPGRTLYILDEPTTGLHFEDIRKLLRVLDRLVEGGNTVVVIEHNLDVIKTADYVIDIGPGGRRRAAAALVAAGTPEEVAAVTRAPTPAASWPTSCPGRADAGARRCERAPSFPADALPGLI